MIPSRLPPLRRRSESHRVRRIRKLGRRGRLDLIAASYPTTWRYLLRSVYGIEPHAVQPNRDGSITFVEPLRQVAFVHKVSV
jgi:hypothetical protein